MVFRFKDIPEGKFKAELSEIRQEKGPYGPYLRLIFTIIEPGDLYHYKFSGFVKPSPFKNSKFYKWITNLLGYPPAHEVHSHQIIGKQCLVYLAKQQNNNFYSVIDLDQLNE